MACSLLRWSLRWCNGGSIFGVELHLSFSLNTVCHFKGYLFSGHLPFSADQVSPRDVSTWYHQNIATNIIMTMHWHRQQFMDGQSLLGPCLHKPCHSGIETRVKIHPITYTAALHKSSQNMIPPPPKTNCSSLMFRVPPLLIDQCHTSCKLPGKNGKESDLFSLSGHIPFAVHVRSNCGWRNRVAKRAPTDSRSVRWNMMKLSNFPNEESKIGTLRGSRVSATKRSCRMVVLLPPQGQTKWTYGLLAGHFPKVSTMPWTKREESRTIPKTIETSNIPSIHIEHESHPQNELRPGGRTSVSPGRRKTGDELINLKASSEGTTSSHTLNMPVNQSLSR